MPTSSLGDEVEKARLQVAADSVSMSITELTNLYREGILQISPEFQRLFRWTSEQKSKLVESLLLGIPLPSFFVAQTTAGVWELVDGLQRVSTLLELQGLLPNPNSPQDKLPPLVLEGTKFLPAMEGHNWDGSGGREKLDEALKLDLRLARLDLKVIKRSSDPKAKFDLFQRLNSFGSTLTGQEIRSAMMAGVSSESLTWVAACAANPDFQKCVSLSERLKTEQYDLELVLRFMMLHQMQSPTRQGLVDFPSKLDDWSVDLATGLPGRKKGLEDVFKKTFAHLAAHGESDMFRRWDDSRGQFRGSFLNTSFEVLAIGAGTLISRGLPVRSDPEEAARELYRGLSGVPRFATGLATADRLVKTLPAGRKLMSNPPGTLSLADWQ